jgi:ABC-type nitrate/sulfonate/bicarbonate transport system substrate-binding protein
VRQVRLRGILTAGFARWRAAPPRQRERGSSATTAAAAAGATTTTSGEKVTLRLGYFPNVTHATALVGVENGIFADALSVPT